LAKTQGILHLEKRGGRAESWKKQPEKGTRFCEEIDMLEKRKKKIPSKGREGNVKGGGCTMRAPTHRNKRKTPYV